MAVNVDINLNLEGTERSESLLKRMTDTIQVQRKELEILNRVGRLQGLEQGENQVVSLLREIAKAVKELKSVTAATDDFSGGLKGVAQAAGLVEESTQGAARGVGALTSRIKENRAELEKGAAATQQFIKNYAETGQFGGMQQKGRGVFYAGSGTVGDVAGDVGTLGSNLGSLTGVEAFGTLGTVGDLVEGTLRLRGSFQELQAAIALQSAANTTLQGSATAAAGASTAAAGGLSSIVLAAAPLVAVGVALGAGYLVLKDNADDARREVESLVNAEKARTDSLQKQRDLLQSLTLEENARLQKQNQQRIDELAAERATLEAELADVTGEGNFLTRLNETAKKDAEEASGLFKIVGKFYDTVIPDSLSAATPLLARLNEIAAETALLSGENADLDAITPDRADLEAAQQWIQLLDSSADRQARLNELVEGGSKAVREEIRSLEDQKQARQNNIRDAIILRDSFEKDSAAWTELNTYIQANIDANGVLTTSIANLRNQALPAAQAVDEQARASERAQKAIEDAAKAFDEAVAVFEKADSELKESVQSRIKAQADVVKAENAIADVQAKRATDDARNAERAAAEQNILDQIENAKRVSAAAKVADNIGRIRDEGYAKEQDIATKFLNDSAKALTDYNAQVADLNRDFARDDLRAHEDYNIARYRLARDLELSLFEAARNNDVSAFITARSRGANQLDDQAVDFGVDRRRAGEDQSSNLQDLRESFEAERAERQSAAQQSIAQTRAEVQERIATEQAGAVQRITQEQVLQQQLADLRAMYAQEDFLARRTEEDARMREQVANAQIRFGLAQQTERLLADQAAIAGRNVGIMLINGFVNGVNQYQNAVAAAGFGAAGSIFQNFNFGNIQVGAGVTPGQVKDEVRAGVQAGIDQMGRQNRAVFRRIEA